MPQLSNKVKELFAKDDDLIYAIAKGMNLKFETVAKWKRGNDPDERLTSRASILIIKEETGLSEEQILEPEPQPAVEA
jgi:hypothetical protein